MEFDKTRGCCPWNSDQNHMHDYARGGREVTGWGRWGFRRWWGLGVVVVKGMVGG